MQKNKGSQATSSIMNKHIYFLNWLRALQYRMCARKRKYSHNFPVFLCTHSHLTSPFRECSRPLCLARSKEGAYTTPEPLNKRFPCIDLGNLSRYPHLLISEEIY